MIIKIEKGVLISAYEEDIINGVLIVPDGVNSIGNWLCYCCRNLTSIVIPDSVSSIGAGFCNYCSNLTSVVILGSIVSIGSNFCNHCCSMTTVVIPNSVTSIGSWFCDGCISLTRVEIKNVKYITKYIDRMLTFIESTQKQGRTIIYEGFWFYPMTNCKINKKPICVAQRGNNFAHGKTIDEAKEDLQFKMCKNRGEQQYKSLTLDSVLSFKEAKWMYRVITGSCRPGTDEFISRLETVKDSYSVREIIKLTENAYRGDVLQKFFDAA